MSQGVQLQFTEAGSALIARSLAGIDSRLARLGGTAGRTAGTLRNVLSRDLNGVTGGFGRLYAMAGGVGLAAGAKSVLNYDQALGQLQADMGITTNEARRLKEEIGRLAKAHGVEKESILGGLQVFQDYGGIVDKGKTILEGLTRVHVATGTSMEELSTIAGTLMQTLGMSPTEALEAVTQFSDQAIKGQVAMRNLARIIPAVLAGGVKEGFLGKRGVTQLGTLLQIAGQATGGRPEEAKTQSLALLRDLGAKEKGLAGAGIKVYRGEGENKQMRDPADIMAAIFRKTKGDPSKLKKVFTEESGAVVGIYKSMFDFKTGTWKKGTTLTNVLGATGGMGRLNKQYDLKTKGIGKEAQAAAQAKQGLDAVLQEYGSAAVKMVAENPAAAGGLAAGGYVGIKWLVPWLAKRMLGGGKGAAGGGGGIAGAIAGGMPVRVMNWPASLGGGSTGMPSGARELAPAALGGAAPGLIASIAAPAIIAMTVGMLSAQKQIEIANQTMDAAESKLSKAMESAGVVAGPARAGAHAFAEGAKDEAAVMLLGPASPIVRALEKLTATRELKEGSFNVTVKAPGLDKPEVQVSRGRKR